MGPAPVALLEGARRAAEQHAQALLAKRREEALAALGTHAEVEEERLVTAAFRGGASRDAVDAALSALRRQLLATENALKRVRLELDAAALVVPR